MQSSIFTVRVPLPDEGDVFLMNTLTEAQAVVSADVATLIDRFDRHAASGDPPPTLDAESARVLGTLVHEGFLVDSVDADRSRLESFFAHVRHDASHLHVTILTTLQCNFACDYCFQGEHDGGASAGRMTRETAARVVDWVAKRLDAVRPERFTVTFFGGEPLLNLPVLYTLAEELWDACASRDIPMRSVVITNGLLLTPTVVERLMPFGLAGIKVTLDGDRDTHDRMRPLRGGQASFDRIVENVRRVADMVPITIGGNFDLSSADSFTGLLDFITTQPFASKLAKVAFKPVIRSTPDAAPSLSRGIVLTPVGSGARSTGGTCASAMGSGRSGHGAASACDSCHLADDKLVWLREETKKRGLPTPDGLHMGPCDVHREHAHTIGPDGSLYACPGFTSDLGHAVGHIDRPATDEHRRSAGEFDRLAPWRACGDCAFIPVCAGGCSVASHTERGDMHTPTCHKRSLESALVSLAHRIVGAPA
ncbi:MAG: radical SAM protein [Vicinamibacterales bacterium]